MSATPRKRTLSQLITPSPHTTLSSQPYATPSTRCSTHSPYHLLRRESESYHEVQPSFSKRSQQSPANSPEYHNKGASDDHYQMLSQDLEMAPELGEVTTRVEQLSLDDDNDEGKGTYLNIIGEETGDELQKKALALAASGQNIFLTGKAGTGKSWTTRKIVDNCRHENQVIHVTAPTGIAAINVNGITIHAWGGFGLGEYYTDFDKMMDPTVMEKIRKTDVLLIEEISMVNGHFLDVLECMISIIRYYEIVKDRIKVIKETAAAGCRTITDTDDDYERIPIMSQHMLDKRWKQTDDGLGDIPAFGNLQVIIVGDFFQLPPIADTNNHNNNNNKSDEFWVDERNLRIGRQGCYAFESHTWQRSDLQVVELTQVHRQAEKDGLFELLNAMREGKGNLMCEHRAALSSLRAPLPPRNDGIVPTELHSRNKSVDLVNNAYLEKLTGEIHTFKSHDKVELHYKYKQKLLKKFRLENYAHMPYLFASVEDYPDPPSLREVRDKLVELEQKKNMLIANEDYEALVLMKPEIRNAKDNIEVLEKEKKEKSIISVKSINEFLEEMKRFATSGNSSNNNDKNNEDDIITQEHPAVIYENFLHFVRQLKGDFEVIKDHANTRFFEKSCRVKKSIEFKEEAQVMLLWNLDLDCQLANGSRGIVKCFVSTASYRNMLQRDLKMRQVKKDSNKQKECVQTEESKLNLSSTSVPDKYDQDKSKEEKTSIDETETEAENDDNHSMDPGIVENIQSCIKEMTTDSLSDEIRIMDTISKAEVVDLPYVQFINGQKRLIRPHSFQKEFKDCAIASRWQIPLCLAWAISIHKSQGMTIDWLRANIDRCFAPGQAYVACSRGRSLQSMTVENFSLSEIKTSRKVQKFYKSLDSDDVPQYMETWSDTIREFDECQQHNRELKPLMEEWYRNKVCKKCGIPCNIRQVRSLESSNNGRWYIRCPVVYSNGHTFDFVEPKDNFKRKKIDNGDDWHKSNTSPARL